MAKLLDVLVRMVGAIAVLLGGTAFLLFTLLTVLRDLVARYEAPDSPDMSTSKPPRALDAAYFEDESTPEASNPPSAALEISSTSESNPCNAA
jgi:hypothetical protein